MKPIEKIETVNGEELMNLVLPPLRFAVEGLLPQGVCILAGRAKTGKSWLVLTLCLAVAAGGAFWNRATQKGDVLYLCLEDSRSRLQQRVLTFTEAPPEMYFAEMAHSLEDGLADQIRWFIDEHPDTRLIVIDTLQKVRSLQSDFRRCAAVMMARAVTAVTLCHRLPRPRRVGPVVALCALFRRAAGVDPIPTLFSAFGAESAGFFGCAFYRKLSSVS